MTRNDPETVDDVGRGSAQTPFGPRIFIKKGIARFDLQDPYYFAVSLSWRKFGLLFISAEVGINLLFATLYFLQPGSIANASAHAFQSAFFFSLETLATVGYGEMYPATAYCHVVSCIEIVTGVAFTAIMTGLLFVRFSKPKAKVQYATKAVITQHNGKPTLMLRFGNARSSFLHDGLLRLHVLKRSISAEGVRHAIIVELPLLRERVPILAVLYTIMHVIDEDSPLYGLGNDSMELADMRFFFTLVARDPAIGQEVSDIHIFEGDKICFGVRYVDAISVLKSGKVVADYTIMSDVVADTPADQDSKTRHIQTVGG